MATWVHTTIARTYVDVNGTLHSGPCATAQEIEDALTEFIVVEADGDASHDDYEYARSIYCFYYPGDLDLCLAESPSPDAEMAGLLPSSGTETYRGPFVGIVWDDANTRPCLMEGIQGGIAAVAWVGSKVAAWHLFTLPATATPPTGAVSLVVFGAVTSGFALAGSAASFLQCLGYD